MALFLTKCGNPLLLFEKILRPMSRPFHRGAISLQCEGLLRGAMFKRAPRSSWIGVETVAASGKTKRD